MVITDVRGKKRANGGPKCRSLVAELTRGGKKQGKNIIATKKASNVKIQLISTF